MVPKADEKLIAVTGHRPEKLGGYDNHEAHRVIRRHMRRFLEARLQEEELILISGGALGIDQFWIEVGLYLQLPVIAALPFEGYNSRWPKASREKYEKLLAQCSSVRYICQPGYAGWKLQKRNQWMVDECNELVAYWNGSPGGTKNCYEYAIAQNKTIHRFNPDEKS